MERLDAWLVSHGLVSGRSKAKELIEGGMVTVNGKTVKKAAVSVSDTDEIVCDTSSIRYVGRGGYKLEKALTMAPISLKDAVAMDVGASTGGFTDCMLQNGASKVYAIDVGYGQLDWKLRTDERVVNLERTNFRYVTKTEVPDSLDFASVDVSFISLSHILPVMRNLLKEGGCAVCLIKPQFEAGKENVGKKGVVREKSVHIAVIEKIIGLIDENKFSLLGLDFSPVKGPEGNIEYLCYIRRDETPCKAEVLSAEEVVNLSYETLNE